MDQNAYLESLEARYNLPRGYLARIRQIESSGDDRAVSPTGASGPFQFTKGTAGDYGLVDRFDFAASAEAAAKLAADNRKALTERLGRDVGGPELYLAHQQGATGASNLLSGGTTDQFNMDVNGGKGMTPGDFADMWVNKYNGTSGGSGGGSEFSVSTMGDAQMQPFTERQGIIKQLLGGEGMAGKFGPMFNPVAGANPRLEQERFQRRQALMDSIGRTNDIQMSNTNAPVSMWQTLAGVGSAAGGGLMGNAAETAGSDLDAQLQELLASGSMSPEVLARITALDPEYGQTMMNDQRGFEQSVLLNEQNQQFALGRDQAAREHELLMASLPSEKRTAMEQQLIAAGYDPNGPIGEDGLNDFQREMRRQLDPTSNAPGLSVTFDEAGNPVIRQGPGVTNGAATTPPPGVPGADVGLGTGKIGEGMARGTGPNGELLEAPIPGSEIAVERDAADAAAANAENSKLKSANDVLSAIDQVEKLSDSFFSTGAVGKLLRDVGIGGTPAYDIQVALNPIIANLGFDRLQQMRAASTSGAALGQITERENTLLQSTIKNLDPNAGKELFKQNLQYVKDQYDVIINTDPNDPASVKRYEEVMGFPLEERSGTAAAPAAAPAAVPTAAPTAVQAPTAETGTITLDGESYVIGQEYDDGAGGKFKVLADGTVVDVK